VSHDGLELLRRGLRPVGQSTEVFEQGLAQRPNGSNRAHAAARFVFDRHVTRQLVEDCVFLKRHLRRRVRSAATRRGEREKSGNTAAGN